MLKRLERGTGRKVHELFDLICGTSTGGMLAVGVGIHKHELDRVTQMYADLGSRIFSKMRSSGSDEQQSYSKALRDRLDSLYTSGQQAIRVGVTGSKHDPTLFESLVRQECRLPTPLDPTRPHEPALIDTGLMPGPKVFVVATLVSVNPAAPYVFRNYEYPAGMEDAASGGVSVGVGGGRRRRRRRDVFRGHLADDGQLQAPAVAGRPRFLGGAVLPGRLRHRR